MTRTSFSPPVLCIMDGMATTDGTTPTNAEREKHQFAIRLAEFALREAGVTREAHIVRLVHLEGELAEIGVALDGLAAELGIRRWDRREHVSDYIDDVVGLAIKEGKGL